MQFVYDDAVTSTREMNVRCPDQGAVTTHLGPRREVFVLVRRARLGICEQMLCCRSTLSQVLVG